MTVLEETTEDVPVEANEDNDIDSTMVLDVESTRELLAVSAQSICDTRAPFTPFPMAVVK